MPAPSSPPLLARAVLARAFLARTSLNRALLACACLAAVFLGAACDARPAAALDAAAGTHKIQAVATTSIITDWVKNLGGGDVDLKTLVGPDGDPHEYEPVPADNLTLAGADLVFENGLGLEPWLDKLYASSDSHATRVVLTRGIGPRTSPDASGGAGGSAADGDFDPHAWQDVNDAQAMVGNIRDALIKADPAHAAGYESRAAAYLLQLASLDAWVRGQIDSIPPARRKLVTSHDAFGYFGQRYGLNVSQSALESFTTDASDPSAHQLADVVRQIRASGVPVIFLENIQNPRLIDQIAAEANVAVGPPLYTDALGPPGSAGDTYIKMIQYNVRTLVKALS